MLKFLRKIHGAIWRYKRNVLMPLKWHLEAIYLRHCSRKAIAHLVEVEHDKKYLILAPHSDDEWIGCSQIIMNCPNSIICNMDMSGGDSEEIHQKRFDEMQSLAKKFDRKFVPICDNKAEALRKLVSQVKPDFIMVPHFVDWHKEHHQVMHLLETMILQGVYSGTVLTYQVSVPFVDREHCLFCPMTKEQQKHKWDIFIENYRTQYFMPVERFKACEYINGAAISSYAAELYKSYDSKDWVTAMQESGEDTVTMDRLAQNINDIIRIRRIIGSISNPV